MCPIDEQRAVRCHDDLMLARQLVYYFTKAMDCARVQVWFKLF